MTPRTSLLAFVSGVVVTLQAIDLPRRLTKLASRARQRDRDTVAAMFDERLREFDGDVRTIHDLITNGT